MLRNSFKSIKKSESICEEVCEDTQENNDPDLDSSDNENVPDLDSSDHENVPQVVELPDIGYVVDIKKEDDTTIKTEKVEYSIVNTQTTQFLEEQVHFCPICPKKLSSALDLRSHAHTHKTLKSYMRGKKVSPNTVFRANPLKSVSIFNRPQSYHHCPTCNEYLHIESFFRHVENHRSEENFECNKCDRVFRKMSHLNVHKVRAHLAEFPYKCEVCKKGFVIKRNYDCHVLTHTSKVLPHKCQYCYKSFANPGHLRRHLLIHTENVSYGLKYKVNRCYFCKRSFKNIQDLLDHRDNCESRALRPTTRTRIYMKPGETKKFQCPICPRSYHFIEGLEAHTRRIHNNSKSSKILCSMCGKCVSNIYIHMAGHEGEKPYKCDLCPKTFTTKSVLKQHLLVHSGAKPFVCSKCGKPFNNYYNLQVHERIHKGDRCHKCVICDKGFLEKSYLNKHMRTHQNV